MGSENEDYQEFRVSFLWQFSDEPIYLMDETD
jgi:hypothetical protein